MNMQINLDIFTRQSNITNKKCGYEECRNTQMLLTEVGGNAEDKTI